MTEAAEPTWVSAARAARESGHCRKTIMRWIAQGRLDVEVVEGPARTWRRVRLDQLLELRRLTPASRAASSSTARST